MISNGSFEAKSAFKALSILIVRSFYFGSSF